MVALGKVYQVRVSSFVPAEDTGLAVYCEPQRGLTTMNQEIAKSLWEMDRVLGSWCASADAEDGSEIEDLAQFYSDRQVRFGWRVVNFS